MFNVTDLLIVLILAGCLWTGYRRGFILAAVWLMAWAGALVLAFLLYPPFGHWALQRFPKLGPWADPLAFMVLLIFSQLLLDLVAGRLLSVIPEKVHHSVLNKVLGLVPGLINGLLWAALLAVMLVFLSLPPAQGRFTRRLLPGVEWLNARVTPVFATLLKRNDTPTVGEERTMKLPFRMSDARPRPDLENEMLRLVNQERSKRGLRVLRADPQMTGVARRHSQDMLARGYFSHFTPEGADPFDRMKRAHVYFLTAGENIAITQTLTMAHVGLMKSPGHRANILNPAFGRVGIGILDAGIYGLMITQSFRN
jgi:uncharacterized protein YkwD/uncharacterized membrane protein required for colicin V production